MRNQPRNRARVAKPQRPALRSLAACCLAASLLAGIAIPAGAAEPPTRVTVSKPAAAMPGRLYSWFAMPKVLPIESDARVVDATFRTQLQAALDKALQAKGYRPAAGAKADFVVAYRVGARDVTQTTMDEGKTHSMTPQSAFQCNDEGCSQIIVSGDNGVPEMKLESVSSVEGGLLVEALEPGTVRVLWRGLNRGTVKPGKVSQERLDAVAKNTLAQFPAAAR
ncbi:MAG: DUF4136 domain-containing protein [Luteimonas sp.]